MIDEKKLIAEIKDYIEEYSGIDENGMHNLKWCAMMEALNLVECQPKVGEWIPCSKRLPDDLEMVTVTWVSRAPIWYYEGIKDIPFTAPAMRFEGNWYWSTTLKDYLIEYGEQNVDLVDSVIEITAWQPLPKPWGGEEK